MSATVSHEKSLKSTDQTWTDSGGERGGAINDNAIRWWSPHRQTESRGE